jgi:hypothetical protein
VRTIPRDQIGHLIHGGDGNVDGVQVRLRRQRTAASSLRANPFTSAPRSSTGICAKNARRRAATAASPRDTSSTTA